MSRGPALDDLTDACYRTRKVLEGWFLFATVTPCRTLQETRYISETCGTVCTTIQKQSRPATERSSLPPLPLLLVIVIHHKNVSLVRPACCVGAEEDAGEASGGFAGLLAVGIVKIDRCIRIAGNCARYGGTQRDILKLKTNSCSAVCSPDRLPQPLRSETWTAVYGRISMK